MHFWEVRETNGMAAVAVIIDVYQLIFHISTNLSAIFLAVFRLEVEELEFE